MPQRPDARTLPLRPSVFLILLSLAEGTRHGLGIADDVEAASGGAVELGPGTLYRSLAEMTDAGLIRLVRAPDQHADPRRKYYRITATGRSLLAAEARRLQQLIGAARARNVLTDAT